MKNMNRGIARGAVLLALALLAQSLRLLAPLPPLAGMFVIGSLVNAVLLLTAVYSGRVTAVAVGVMLPFAAFLQGQLPAPVFIPGVAAGNAVFACFGQFFWRRGALYFAPFLKAGVLYIGAWAALRVAELQPGAAKAVSALMSWPQIVTAFCGILLARALAERVRFKA